jgi:hypothetical protein
LRLGASGERAHTSGCWRALLRVLACVDQRPNCLEPPVLCLPAIVVGKSAGRHRTLKIPNT